MENTEKQIVERFLKITVIVVVRWAGHVTRIEEGRSAFKILTGIPAGKTPLGRPRRRWKDNSTIDIKEIDTNTKNWVD